MKLKLVIIIAWLSLGFFSCNRASKTNHKEIFYIGTYSVRSSEGIYVYEFNRDSMKMNLIQTVDHLKNPSYLTLAPNGKFLYAANGETVNDSMNFGSISAYAVDASTGKLTHINDKSSYGSDPCHIQIDHGGKSLFISNYNNGRLVFYNLKADGSISDNYRIFQDTGKSVNPARQESAHVHSTLVSPNDKYVYVDDLGLDKIMIFRYDSSSASMDPGDPPYVATLPGAGPRHMALHPNLPYLYLIQELSNNVSVFSLQNEAAPVMIQTLSALPEHYDSVNDAADIHVLPSGNFVYSSNRGQNTIAIFKVDPATGRITRTGEHSCGGNWPRAFLVDPEGQFLFVANERSDNLALLKVNGETGELSETGVSVKIPSPVCVKRLEL